MAKTILKRTKLEDYNLPGLKIYYKCTVIKAVWYWHKHRQRKQ